MEVDQGAQPTEAQMQHEAALLFGWIASTQPLVGVPLKAKMSPARVDEPLGWNGTQEYGAHTAAGFMRVGSTQEPLLEQFFKLQVFFTPKNMDFFIQWAKAVNGTDSIKENMERSILYPSWAFSE